MFVLLQIMDFTQEEVAIFIAIVGVLSVVAQVSHITFININTWARLFKTNNFVS